jgi:hypothetical protein
MQAVTAAMASSQALQALQPITQAAAAVVFLMLQALAVWAALVV